MVETVQIIYLNGIQVSIYVYKKKIQIALCQKFVFSGLKTLDIQLSDWFANLQQVLSC